MRVRVCARDLPRLPLPHCPVDVGEAAAAARHEERGNRDDEKNLKEIIFSTTTHKLAQHPAASRPGTSLRKR